MNQFLDLYLHNIWVFLLVTIFMVLPIAGTILQVLLAVIVAIATGGKK